MTRVLITGATGLVGSSLVKACQARNMYVHYLTTNRSKIIDNSRYKGFYWNPESGEIDAACMEGVELIINLAGAPISKRWTRTYKQEILDSRLKSLQLLHDTLTTHTGVKRLISASAIGIYPSSLTHYYEETHPIESDGFLSVVTQKWEARMDRFEELGIKVAKIRIGVVLSDKGGALMKMANPVRFGAGAAFGSGEQWQSWIHIEDLTALFMHVIDNNLWGCYNAVSPNAVRQQELIKTIAKTVKRPLLFPNIPAFAVKMLLGEMSALVLESQHVSAQKIEWSGFNFKYYHLEPALADLL